MSVGLFKSNNTIMELFFGYSLRWLLGRRLGIKIGMDLRKLDLLIAEKIMGWHSIQIESWEKYWTSLDPEAFPPEAVSLNDVRITGITSRDLVKYRREIPFYSASISASWDVLDKLKANLKMTREQLGKITIELRFVCGEGSTGSIVEATGDSAPHAICLAALKARGL